MKPDRLNSSSLHFIEDLYAEYLQNADSVTEEWRQYFDSLGSEDGAAPGYRATPNFRPHRLFQPSGGNGGRSVNKAELVTLQHRVDQMIRNFRMRGHIIARLDPLGIQRPRPPELDPRFYGFTRDDMRRAFSTESIPGRNVRTLRSILKHLHSTYCRSIGVQFMHIDNLHVRNWIQQRIERTQNRLELSRSEQLRILTRLTDAVIFEEFLRKKYVGAKSFSLEGGESLIPLLDLAIERAGGHGMKEIVIGMPHRGRLNVLVNIMGKSPREVFREFDDSDALLSRGRGDVKYHLGYHSDWKTASGNEVHVALCFNPSHLGFVGPVALGRVRAKQDRIGDVDREKCMALLIHGDAAFAGEGIVQETLNLSELKGYRTGGTLHVIVNNQIGFTTDPGDARSMDYATDIARMLQSPIFHVNGEDPEAVAQAVTVAMEFRMQFKRDVVIDMYCYRRHGHNEGDEPSFTQPLLYQAIEKRKPVREGYLEHLLELDGVTAEEADRIAEIRRQNLEAELSAARQANPDTCPVNPLRPSILGRVWKHYRGGPENGDNGPDTGVSGERLRALLESMAQTPPGFTPHPKVERLLQQRARVAAGEQPLDWGTGEALAFATLATEGVRLRLSGQDCERGTFSHRHAVLHDYRNGQKHTPLQHLSPDQAPVEICNSPLSEAGVLGFEYGYSIAYPDGLVLWEAQFGDFCNAAQVIVDQFIASAEDKWRSLTGLVLLLPHGYEGQGPEHSSARLERFLVLAAEDNMQIANPTTPAQFFHLLRRQVHRPWRKPLVVLTPKSLLRHPEAVSSLEDLTAGRFHRVLADDGHADPAAVRRILLCSGKIYYDLVQKRRELDTNAVAILRVEQLYPLGNAHLEKALAPYKAETPAYWVQEEPENMGAWPSMKNRFCPRFLGRYPIQFVGRPPSASPATGSAGSHRDEQEELLNQAFADL